MSQFTPTITHNQAVCQDWMVMRARSPLRPCSSTGEFRRELPAAQPQHVLDAPPRGCFLRMRHTRPPNASATIANAVISCQSTALQYTHGMAMQPVFKAFIHLANLPACQRIAIKRYLDWPMKLFFLRHAEAVPGENDTLRALSKDGRRQARDMGAFFASAGIEFAAAFSSPLVRARQTAEIVLELSNKKKPVKLQLTDMLLNTVEPQEFDSWLRRIKTDGRVLLVGHNPSMAEHVARLLDLPMASAIPMAKGAVAYLRWEPPDAAKLKLYITPKHVSWVRA